MSELGDRLQALAEDRTAEIRLVHPTMRRWRRRQFRRPIEAAMVAVTALAAIVVLNVVSDRAPIQISIGPSTPATTVLSPTRPTGSVLVVSANAASGSEFVAPADGTYRFSIQPSSRYCTAPDLCRSVVRGYVNGEIVWSSPPIPEPIRWDATLGCFEEALAAIPDCGRMSRWP